MPIETDKPDFTPADLNPAWPLEDDEVGAGDDHLRLLKKALKYAWDNKLFPSPGGDSGGGGYSVGDIRYTSLDKDDTSVQEPEFVFASGQAISRTKYADLFAKLGVRFGDGDGSTTFNVPDVNKGFIPADVGIFSEGNSSGIPNGYGPDWAGSNPVTGTLVIKSYLDRWFMYRRVTDTSWTLLPKPSGLSTPAYSSADIIAGDIIVVYYKTSGGRMQRITWQIGVSADWSDPVEFRFKPNEVSSPQDLDMNAVSITPDGALEVATVWGSNNIYFRRPGTDGNFFFRSTTNTYAQPGSPSISDDGKFAVFTVSGKVTRYAVGASKPYEGTFTDLVVPPANLSDITFAEGYNIFGVHNADIYWFNEPLGSWEKYTNNLSTAPATGVTYDGTTAQLVLFLGTSSPEKLYRMTAGAAAARVMGYVKT